MKTPKHSWHPTDFLFDRMPEGPNGELHDPRPRIEKKHRDDRLGVEMVKNGAGEWERRG